MDGRVHAICTVFEGSDLGGLCLHHRMVPERFRITQAGRRDMGSGSGFIFTNKWEKSNLKLTFLGTKTGLLYILINSHESNRWGARSFLLVSVVFHGHQSFCLSEEGNAASFIGLISQSEDQLCSVMCLVKLFCFGSFLISVWDGCLPMQISS